MVDNLVILNYIEKRIYYYNQFNNNKHIPQVNNKVQRMQFASSFKRIDSQQNLFFYVMCRKKILVLLIEDSLVVGCLSTWETVSEQAAILAKTPNCHVLGASPFWLLPVQHSPRPPVIVYLLSVTTSPPPFALVPPRLKDYEAWRLSNISFRNLHRLKTR